MTALQLRYNRATTVLHTPTEPHVAARTYRTGLRWQEEPVPSVGKHEEQPRRARSDSIRAA